MARKWKEGDRARIYRVGHDQSEEIDGMIYDLSARVDHWWFVPQGGMFAAGECVSERELHEVTP